MGKRRNIRITARATRATAKNTAGTTAAVRQQAAADQAARDREHRLRYTTDPTYRAFSDADARYRTEMVVYTAQAKQARRRATLGLLAEAIIIPVLAIAGLLLFTVWSVQRLRARGAVGPAYWQRDQLQTTFGRVRALGVLHLPPAPQMTAISP